MIEVVNGTIVDRISPWSNYVVQNTSGNIYESMFWNPPNVFKFVQSRPKKPHSLRIYESHVGISSENYGIASYTYFKDNLLPYIKDIGR